MYPNFVKGAVFYVWEFRERTTIFVHRNYVKGPQNGPKYALDRPLTCVCLVIKNKGISRYTRHVKKKLIKKQGMAVTNILTRLRALPSESNKKAVNSIFKGAVHSSRLHLCIYKYFIHSPIQKSYFTKSPLPHPANLKTFFLTASMPLKLNSKVSIL